MILRRTQILRGLRQISLRPLQYDLRWTIANRQSTSGPSFLGSKPISPFAGQQDTQDAPPPSLPHIVDPPKPVPFTLRPYQHEAVDACLQALSSGRTRIGVSSPTGSGKTTMFMHLIPRVVDPVARQASEEEHTSGDGAGDLVERLSTLALDSNKRDVEQSHIKATGLKDGMRRQTLIVVNGVELVNQAEGAAKRLLPKDWTIEVEQSSRKASGFADVTIATYQTLIKEERLRKFDPSRFGLVIIDEAHHSASKSYLRLLHYFNRDVKLPSSVEPVISRDHQYLIPLVGFSATFSRNDMMALSDVYEEIVYHREVREMLQEGWLCPANVTKVEADLHLEDVPVNPTTGDFSAPSLAKQLDTPEVRSLVLKSYLYKGQNRRSTLIFCTNLTHVENLKITFREAGVDARSVSSEQPARERQRLMKDFGEGRFPVLINCEVLTEGTDIPQIDCIILARPTKSQNLMVQMVGRGLRQSPESGKKDCRIIDMVDNTSRGLVATPTLSGLSYEDVEALRAEKDERAEGETLAAAVPLICVAAAKMALESDPQTTEITKVTMVDVDDPFGIKEATPMSIPQMTKFAWVACGKGIYVLELFNSGYLRIQNAKSIKQANTTVFTIHLTQPMLPTWQQAGREFKPYKETKVLATGDTLNHAFQLGDAFVGKKFGMQGSQPFTRYAPWRERPASEKMTNALWKIRGINQEVEPPWYERKVSIAGKDVLVSKLTLGQCSSALTALKHGAKGRMQNVEKKEIQKESAKERKIMEKQDKAAALAARNLPLPQSS